MQYYERIKELRLKAKLTQTQISEVLQVNQQQYQRWESGKRDFPTKEVVRLAEFFGVSTDYILFGKLDCVIQVKRNLGKKETYSRRYGTAIAKLQADGKSIRQIADILGISPTSVVKVANLMKTAETERTENENN